MIGVLEWTKRNVRQNIEQLQTPTMGVTINKKSTTTTEPPPLNGQQPKSPGERGGGLKCALLLPNLRFWESKPLVAIDNLEVKSFPFGNITEI